MCTYPAGVDDDDDVEESLHFGVLPLVGVWLEGVLGAAASGELFTEGDVDEGAPRYLGGKHILRLFSENVSVSQEIIMMTMMMKSKPIDDDNHIG